MFDFNLSLQLLVRAQHLICLFHIRAEGVLRTCEFLLPYLQCMRDPALAASFPPVHAGRQAITLYRDPDSMCAQA